MSHDRAARLAQVAVAVACHKASPEALVLAKAVLQAQEQHGVRFAAVILVDSQGQGRLVEQARADGLAVVVTDDDHNLGADGNMRRRVQEAAKTGAVYLYALNTDGEFNIDTLDLLVKEAEASGPALGAVYPIHKKAAKGDSYDLTSTLPFPLFFKGQKNRPTTASTARVTWGSSNGALYRVAAMTSIFPMPEVWMCWEDLGYGWALDRAGFTQKMLFSAVYNDTYEYAKTGPVFIHDKPVWYAYYAPRNLLFLSRQKGTISGALAAARIGQEVALTLAFKKNKRARLKLMARGVRDAVAGRLGKIEVP